jgi:uncharacterized protein
MFKLFDGAERVVVATTLRQGGRKTTMVGRLRNTQMLPCESVVSIFWWTETQIPNMMKFGNGVLTMNNIPRILDLNPILERKSLFLFGPRATGKSSFLVSQFPRAKYYDLLDARVFGKLLRSPHLLEEETEASQLVIVDEVQKLPQLLDEVHRLIFKRNQKFILTGSSARKLKRGGANLLAGRALWKSMFPFTFKELQAAKKFDLEKYLLHGGLPQIYNQIHAEQDLRNYTDLYLKEEIQAESFTRNLSGFAGLLDALAISNGQEINLASLASDTGIQARTISNYIEILEDTLLGFALPVYQKTKKRKATARSKFYFFDLGIVNSLSQNFSLPPGSDLFGRAFEHFILLEVRAYLSYFQKIEELSYWRTSAGFEVDIVVGNKLAIEVKSSSQVAPKHFKGLRAFAEEKLPHRLIVVSMDSNKRVTEDGIEIYPWKEFLNSIWNGELY